MLVRISSGRQFEAASDVTLLDAAQAAGITLPYSCKTGRCSTCKGKVLDGITRAVHEELGLSPAEREAGWILTCVRTASADVRLEIEDLGSMSLAPARTLACRIQSLERPAADVIKIVLRFPPAVELRFHAGQYIDVIGPGGIRRSYSLANAPSADRLVELHIRRVPGGVMSDYWFDAAKVNDLLRINGPLGTFVLRDVADRDVVFLATGTGIAPVKAMLEALHARGSNAPSPRSVTVYWGGRRREDLYCDLPAPGGLFHFVPVLSRAEGDLSCEHGYVQDIAMRDRSDWTRTVVFACGNDAMIHSARGALQDAGLDTRHFHSDAFVCSAAA